MYMSVLTKMLVRYRTAWYTPDEHATMPNWQTYRSVLVSRYVSSATSLSMQYFLYHILIYVMGRLNANITCEKVITCGKTTFYIHAHIYSLSNIQ